MATPTARIVDLTAKVAALCAVHNTARWALSPGEPLTAVTVSREDEEHVGELRLIINGGYRAHFCPLFETAADKKHDPKINCWHMPDVPVDLEAALEQALVIMNAYTAGHAA